MNRKDRSATSLLVMGLMLAMPCCASRMAASQPIVQESRTTPPPATSQSKVVHPTGDFNVAEAKAALEPGTGTITGAACVCRFVHHGPTSFTRADREIVVLYPASPYIANMLSLMHKTKAGTASIVADPAITSVRLQGRTNENGQFQFSKIKPGSYYVVADMHSTDTGTRTVYAGTGYGNDAFGAFTTDFYQKQNYSVNFEDILYERVDVQPSEEVHVTLFGGTSLFGFNAMKSKCR